MKRIDKGVFLLVIPSFIFGHVVATFPVSWIAGATVAWGICFMCGVYFLYQGSYR